MRHQQRTLVPPPFPPHERQRGEAKHHCPVKTPQIHPHESYRFEIVDVTYALRKFFHRHLELVPRHLRFLLIGQLHPGYNLVGYVISPNLQRLRAQGYLIVVVALVVAQRVIAIDILRIRYRRCGGRVGLGGLL